MHPKRLLIGKRCTSVRESSIGAHSFTQSPYMGVGTGSVNPAGHMEQYDLCTFTEKKARQPSMPRARLGIMGNGLLRRRTASTPGG